MDKVKELVSSDEDWEFLLDVKYIKDGLVSLTNYQYDLESKSFQLEMKILVATVAALLQVKAKVGNHEVVFCRSIMMNKIYGNILIHYFYEKDTYQNNLMEYSILNTEIEKLKPCS